MSHKISSVSHVQHFVVVLVTGPKNDSAKLANPNMLVAGILKVSTLRSFGYYGTFQACRCCYNRRTFAAGSTHFEPCSHDKLSVTFELAPVEGLS